MSSSSPQLIPNKLNSPEVTRRMMVRAQADDISEHVWPVVRRAKRLDVASFCIPRTISQEESNAAKLALVVVQYLHAVRESGIAEDARNRCLDPFHGW